MFFGYTQRDWQRYGGFLLLNTVMAVMGTFLILASRSMGQWYGVGSAMAAMALLATVSFAVMYPILRRMRPGLWRFVVLYVAFLITMLLIPAVSSCIQEIFSSDDPITPGKILVTIMTMFDPPPFEANLLPLYLFACHLFGFPALLVIAGVNKWLSPVFFPRITGNA